MGPKLTPSNHILEILKKCEKKKLIRAKMTKSNLVETLKQVLTPEASKKKTNDAGKKKAKFTSHVITEQFEWIYNL